MTALSYAIPNIGSKMVQPDGTVSRDWYLFLSAMLQTIGGPAVVTGGGISPIDVHQQFEEYAASNIEAQEALRGVDELRNAGEKSSDTRTDELVRQVDELRNDLGRMQDPQIHELARMVEELRGELAGIRGMRDMRSRLEDLEATLCGMPSVPAAYVSSVNGKRDNAVLAVADIAGAAPLANPVFTGVTTSPKFQTATASVSAANGVATTVYALPNAAVAMYLASVNIGSVADAVNWGAFAAIATDGASARIVFSYNTGVQTITLSGLNIQTTQGSGGTQTANITVTKIG